MKPAGRFLLRIRPYAEIPFKILHKAAGILPGFPLIVAVILAILCAILLIAFIRQIFLSPPVQAGVPAFKRRTASELVIQLSIQNASGAQGIARKAMDYYRARGFDVVEIKNARKLEDISYVIDLVADTASAHNVAYAAGIPDSLIVHDIDSSLYLRASLILGKNYKSLKPFR
jgi:hypothetical protein